MCMVVNDVLLQSDYSVNCVIDERALKFNEAQINTNLKNHRPVYDN